MRTGSADCCQNSIYVLEVRVEEIPPHQTYQLVRILVLSHPYISCVSIVSHDSIRREEEVQGGRTAMAMRRVMVGYDVESSKDRVLRGAAAMKIDISQFGHVSEKG